MLNGWQVEKRVKTKRLEKLDTSDTFGECNKELYGITLEWDSFGTGGKKQM